MFPSKWFESTVIHSCIVTLQAFSKGKYQKLSPSLILSTQAACRVEEVMSIDRAFSYAVVKININVQVVEININYIKT
jgi:hypothetical protein